MEGEYGLLFHLPLFPCWQTGSLQTGETVVLLCFWGWRSSNGSPHPCSPPSSGLVGMFQGCVGSIPLEGGRPSSQSCRSLEKDLHGNLKFRWRVQLWPLSPILGSYESLHILSSLTGIKAVLLPSLAKELHYHRAFQDLLSIYNERRSGYKFVLLILLVTYARRGWWERINNQAVKIDFQSHVLHPKQNTNWLRRWLPPFVWLMAPH